MTHTIVLAGGGTGGHVTPALALAEAFRARRPDARVLFIGTERGMEATLVPKKGWPIHLVAGSRLVGGGWRAKLAGLRSLWQGVRQSRQILRDEQADLVVGVGGYASGAALLAARSLGIATAIHESNAVAGLTNRVLGQFVDRVYVGFKAAQAQFPDAVVSGNPVRAAIAQTSHLPRAHVARVLVVGGSQGSEFLNSHVPGLLRAVGVPLEVRHQVGKLDPEPVRSAYAEAGLQASVEGFIDDMAAAYAWADLAVTRSGSGTVSELAAAGVPALLVPFPFAAGDHQAWNAKAYADAGAGHWVRQEAWQEAALAEHLRTLLTDADAWQRASHAARAFGKPDAAVAVVDDCLRWMEGR
jgi:UDP-N-acetylglucosamine--N-acetylmuramyl-(pentapeptide) pyrophosphoryl-undecaprenol N-acetylglucosamine transferase